MRADMQEFKEIFTETTKKSTPRSRQMSLTAQITKHLKAGEFSSAGGYFQSAEAAKAITPKQAGQLVAGLLRKKDKHYTHITLRTLAGVPRVLSGVTPAQIAEAADLFKAAKDIYGFEQTIGGIHASPVHMAGLRAGHVAWAVEQQWFEPPRSDVNYHARKLIDLVLQAKSSPAAHKGAEEGLANALQRHVEEGLSDRNTKQLQLFTTVAKALSTEEAGMKPALIEGAQRGLDALLKKSPPDLDNFSSALYFINEYAPFLMDAVTPQHIATVFKEHDLQVKEADHYLYGTVMRSIQNHPRLMEVVDARQFERVVATYADAGSHHLYRLLPVTAEHPHLLAAAKLGLAKGLETAADDAFSKTASTIHSSAPALTALLPQEKITSVTEALVKKADTTDLHYLRDAVKGAPKLTRAFSLGFARGIKAQVQGDLRKEFKNVVDRFKDDKPLVRVIRDILRSAPQTGA